MVTELLPLMEVEPYATLKGSLAAGAVPVVRLEALFAPIALERVEGRTEQEVGGTDRIVGRGNRRSLCPRRCGGQLVVHGAGDRVLAAHGGNGACQRHAHLRAVHLRSAAVAVASFCLEFRQRGRRIIQHRDALARGRRAPAGIRHRDRHRQRTRCIQRVRRER